MKMRYLVLALGLALSGCAGQSIEEMRDEALLTGDWSRVNAYESRVAREEQYKYAAKQCLMANRSLILVCDKHHRDPQFDVQKDCSCTSRQTIYEGIRRY